MNILYIYTEGNGRIESFQIKSHNNTRRRRVHQPPDGYMDK